MTIDVLLRHAGCVGIMSRNSRAPSGNDNICGAFCLGETAAVLCPLSGLTTFVERYGSTTLNKTTPNTAVKGL